jgi:hypothetical protein
MFVITVLGVAMGGSTSRHATFIAPTACRRLCRAWPLASCGIHSRAPLRGLTIGEYLASRDPVAGMVYIVMLAVLAIMPLLVARRIGS